MKSAKILLSIIIVLLCLLISSCKKEEVKDDVLVDSGNNSLDRFYLQKMLSINNFSNTLDTTQQSTYTYDNLKRLIKIKKISKSYGPVFSSDSTIFFYTNFETLPYKFEEFTIDNYNQSKDTSIGFFRYNNSNLIYDSLISTNHKINQNSYTVQKIITNRNYVDNKIYSSSKSTVLFDNSLSINPYLKKDTFTLDANKNIIEIKTTQISGNNFLDTSRNIDKVTFDNKPSPFSTQNIPDFYNFSRNYSKNGIGFLGVKNNILTVNSFKPSGAFIFNITLTDRFQYLSNGMPSFLTWPNLDPTKYEKVVFLYQNL
jgi:hypothetical protein